MSQVIKIDRPTNVIPEKPKSEKEIISYLEEKQTNFVFLFGKQGRGKTAITASNITPS